MGAVNPDLHRWILASFAKHLHTKATAGGIALVVEFLNKRTPTWEASSPRAEALITGPMTKEISTGIQRAWVDVFITLTTNRGSNDYGHIDAAGVFANALDQCVLVKDYGDTGLIEVGSMSPISDTGQTVSVQHLKPIEADETIHSTIQARFYGLFSE